MKEQIEEIENTLITISKNPIMIEGLEHWSDVIAEELYNAGYRKQKEGEWIENPIDNYDGEPSGLYYVCSVCHTENGFEDTPFCPNCGAHMRGGENE